MLIGGRAHNLEELYLVSEAQLDFVEINLFTSLPPFYTLPSLLKLKQECNLFFLIHGPEEGNPFDCVALRNSLLPQMKTVIDFAHELTVQVITIHLWLDQRFLESALILDKLVLLEEMMNLALKKDITLCLENLSERTIDLAQAFSQFPHLGLTLDIGHGELLTPQNTSYSFIETYPTRIRHVHIHDNYGGTTPGDDLHLPLGKGTIDFEPILRRLCASGYDGTITLEVAPPFLHEGKENLRKILSALENQ